MSTIDVFDYIYLLDTILPSTLDYLIPMSDDFIPLLLIFCKSSDECLIGCVLIGWTTWKGYIKGFVPLGMCLVAVMQWRAYRKVSDERTATTLEINAYRILPLRMASRFWGWIAGNCIFYLTFIHGRYVNVNG